MTGREIRTRFLEYFRSHDHTIVSSSSLVPQRDPTLLFTNAGMVQFKDVFLGEEKRPYRRATSSQKCVRAGGKHNDLEIVGSTGRHHTFFEMLGNFSFGDYFKEEAIRMGWEFLTRDLGLSKERLWVTVFQDDDEAHRLWKEKMSVPAERIVRMGEKDNFWAMGDTGPCGPCSEIIYDQGINVGCKRPTCDIYCECDRHLEIWNLVFMQYYRDAQGTMEPLPLPSIDTGMGLERISAVLQGVDSNYETDLFTPLIKQMEELAGKTYGEENKDDVSIQVVVDHARACTFLVADGVLPSNEGRGYVLRRIIRRAARHGKKLNLEAPFLFRLSNNVIDQMKDAYPELQDRGAFVEKVLLNEEERFLETLSKGMQILSEEMAKIKEGTQKILPGEVVFRLYDTYGFPMDLTADIAGEQECSIDEEGFQRAMEEQRRMAREAWKGSGEEEVDDIYKKINREEGATRFVGYETLQGESMGLVILKEGKRTSQAGAGDKVDIVVSETPFYGESGGQVGDQGEILGPGGKGVVINSTRPLSSLIVHHVRIDEGELKEGEKVVLKVAPEQRRRIALNHTATHLLQRALRTILGEHVKQAGSLVAPDRLRFDFTHFSAIETEQLDSIESLINEKIQENLPVDVEHLSYQEALDRGAVALFGEKYGEEVRMVSLGDYSSELCGGTHTQRSGDIGLFKVISEGGIASGVRRIEAFTGPGAYQWIKGLERELKDIGTQLRASPGEISPKVTKLLQQQRDLEKQMEKMKGRLAGQSLEDLLEEVKEINGVKVLATVVQAPDQKLLRELADRLRDRMASGIVVLGNKQEGKARLLAAVTKDLTKRFHAGKLIKEIAPLVKGKGGGRPDMAEAGGDDPEGLSQALERARQVIAENPS